MSPRIALLQRIFLLVLLGAVTSGCAREERNCPCLGAESEAVAPALLAFLSRARAAHHEADLREANPEQSLQPLILLVKGPLPGSPGNYPAEVREVLADTAARIADLESTLGRFDSANQRIDEALPLVPDTSYFRGHLFETRGLLLQRRAESLSMQGNVETAKDVRARAVEAFEAAMEIQAAVIRTTQPSSNPNPPPKGTSR